MAKVHVFLDEGGDMTFEPKPKGRRYFIIGSITLDTCGVGNELLALRRELLWQGFAGTFSSAPRRPRSTVASMAQAELVFHRDHSNFAPLSVHAVRSQVSSASSSFVPVG
jgi:hypothetical protein